METVWAEDGVVTARGRGETPRAASGAAPGRDGLLPVAISLRPQWIKPLQACLEVIKT